ALLKAVPAPDPARSVPRDLPRGEIPDAAAPPLGCSFHPRCPMAFERCGWEARDLPALFEQHWLTLDEDDYRHERSLIAGLDRLNEPGRRAELVPAKGHTVTDVLALVERIRKARADDPLWRGVRDTRVEGDTVVVEFHEGEDPALRRAGHVDVACHLYRPAPDDEMASLTKR